MFEKIMVAIAGMNQLDKNNEYFITKRMNEYILCRVNNYSGNAWDIAFSNNVELLKKAVMEVYAELYYKESE